MGTEKVDKKEMVKLKELIILYSSALKIVNTKIEILNENYKHSTYNPIEHIKARIKSLDSIYEKLERKGHPITIESIKENIDDIAGIRIICAFSKDIYELATLLKAQSDMEFIREIDYITSPKPSGYRSYHMVVKVPVYTPKSVEYAKVEIQIRTEAMDFWACLEHKAKYKYDGVIPEALSNEFKECAKKISELDQTMFLIQEKIHHANEKKTDNHGGKVG